MAHRNADQVRALFDAINAGEERQASEFFHPELRQRMLDLSASRPQIRVVRLLEDGPFVLAQLRFETSSEDKFAVYRYEDGQIAEQWIFSSDAAPPNKSGHTQVDGPAEPRELESTEANKLFVRRYYETFHLSGDHCHSNEFFIGDTMIRHEPGVQDGLGNFLRDVEQLMKHRTIDEIKLLIGEGDLVFIEALGTHEGKPCAYIDLYRVENRKIVEHWGFPQML